MLKDKNKNTLPKIATVKTSDIKILLYIKHSSPGLCIC